MFPGACDAPRVEVHEVPPAMANCSPLRVAPPPPVKLQSPDHGLLPNWRDPLGVLDLILSRQRLELVEELFGVGPSRSVAPLDRRAPSRRCVVGFGVVVGVNFGVGVGAHRRGAADDGRLLADALVAGEAHRSF